VVKRERGLGFAGNFGDLARQAGGSAPRSGGDEVVGGEERASVQIGGAGERGKNGGREPRIKFSFGTRIKDDCSRPLNPEEMGLFYEG